MNKKILLVLVVSIIAVIIIYPMFLTCSMDIRGGHFFGFVKSYVLESNRLPNDHSEFQEFIEIDEFRGSMFSNKYKYYKITESMCKIKLKRLGRCNPSTTLTIETKSTIVNDTIQWKFVHYRGENKNYHWRP